MKYPFYPKTSRHFWTSVDTFLGHLDTSRFWKKSPKLLSLRQQKNMENFEVSTSVQQVSTKYVKIWKRKNLGEPENALGSYYIYTYI